MKIIRTEDGSDSVFNIELNETYHSVHGAYSESTHVFIKNGFNFLVEKGLEALNILEVGFGTGLNFFLTYEANKKSLTKVFYHTLEPYPLNSDITDKIDFGISFSDSDLHILKKSHNAEWNQEITFSDKFSFRKSDLFLEDAKLPSKHFDLVYYDAFAPSKQPDMWKIEMLKKVDKSMKANGILVTYCAQGQFRRNLKELGFEVERLSGPPGKKEMTRAEKIKNSEQ